MRAFARFHFMTHKKFHLISDRRFHFMSDKFHLMPDPTLLRRRAAAIVGSVIK